MMCCGTSRVEKGVMWGDSRVVMMIKSCGDGSGDFGLVFGDLVVVVMRVRVCSGDDEVVLVGVMMKDGVEETTV